MVYVTIFSIKFLHAQQGKLMNIYSLRVNNIRSRQAITITYKG